jgi:hypothetical protein
MVTDGGCIIARARQDVRAIPSVGHLAGDAWYGQRLGRDDDRRRTVAVGSTPFAAHPVQGWHMPILSDHVDAAGYKYGVQRVRTRRLHKHRRCVLHLVLYTGMDCCGFVGVSHATGSGGLVVVEVGNLASIASVSLAFLLAIVGGFRYVTAQVDSLRREILAVEKNAQLFAEKSAETEARQRHSATNSMQVFLTKMESEVRTLQREAVRQDQMDALENRLSSALSKIEIKVDKLSENAAEIVAIKTVLTVVNSRLERISDRLDEAGGVNKNTRT